MKKFLYTLTAVAMLVLPSCSKSGKPSTTHTSGTITLWCDNTFENIMSQEVDVFEYQYPDAHILIQYVPQGEALDSLMSGATKSIVISRDLTDKERERLKGQKRQFRSSKIAVDAVALIVNQENPIEKLTTAEIADILSGTSSQWNDLWPTDLGEISVVFDHQSSSLVAYMRDSLLDGRELAKNVYAQGSVQEVFKAVKENKNAIGVLGVSWITTDMQGAVLSQEELAAIVNDNSPVEGAGLSNEVKVLAIYREEEARAYKPYQQNIFDGTYPLFRQIYMITTGVPGSLDVGFYSFVTGVIGQKIILKTGILPARVNRVQVVELTD